MLKLMLFWSRTTLSKLMSFLVIIDAARFGKPRMKEAWQAWVVKRILTHTSHSPLILYEELQWVVVMAVLILVVLIKNSIRLWLKYVYYRVIICPVLAWSVGVLCACSSKTCYFL